MIHADYVGENFGPARGISFETTYKQHGGREGPANIKGAFAGGGCLQDMNDKGYRGLRCESLGQAAPGHAGI